MAKINLTAFHNQDKFMQDVRGGDKIIAQSDQELAAKPVEKCEFEPGDLVNSIGTGTVIQGQFGLVIDKELIGKYWRVKVRWSARGKDKPYETSERAQDIVMFSKGWQQFQDELKEKMAGK